MAKYIGIDPSTKTGLVILNDDGSVFLNEEVKTKVDSDPGRFMDIASQVMNTIHVECHEEDVKIMIENFSFGSKGRAVSTQYGIGWAIRIELVKHGLPYTEVAPGGLKKFASGKGNTKKDELVLPIYKKWGFESNSDNVRDAYVLAQIGRYLDGLDEPTKYQEDVLKKVSGS